MLEEAGQSADEAQQVGLRVDWRTGKPMLQHDDAFWREQERRRVELGMTVPQYCAANGLALSTYRHRVSGKKRTGAKTATSSSQSSPTPAFVAVTPAPTETAVAIEIALEGMTMRLCGTAAESVLARVMERLA